MEKMNLARNIFKTVYGFRFRTIDQRFKNTAEEFLALSEECSKVKADPNIKNILSSSPKEAKHVCEVKQQCDESIIKLAEQYDHFKVFFLSLSLLSSQLCSPNCLMVIYWLAIMLSSSGT
ncbi:hypothetical protein MKW92_032003 [Papaver armeniacum]|nr:hypothetical protein MKW92_032003 [Papaver armeniacum]